MVAESLQRDDGGRILRLQIIVFLFSLAVFLAAPVIEVSDSRYAALLSECFWRHRTAELDEYYKVPLPGPSGDAGRPDEANKYQLVKARGHVTYFFPHATSMLSIPLVAAMNAVGVSAATPDGRLNLAGEIRIGRAVASVLMAGLTCVFFAMAVMMLPVSWSVVVALGASLGSQILSTAARESALFGWGLWWHGSISCGRREWSRYLPSASTCGGFTARSSSHTPPYSRDGWRPSSDTGGQSSA